MGEQWPHSLQPSSASRTNRANLGAYFDILFHRFVLLSLGLVDYDTRIQTNQNSELYGKVQHSHSLHGEACQRMPSTALQYMAGMPTHVMVNANSVAATLAHNTIQIELVHTSLDGRPGCRLAAHQLAPPQIELVAHVGRELDIICVPA